MTTLTTLAGGVTLPPLIHPPLTREQKMHDASLDIRLDDMEIEDPNEDYDEDVELILFIAEEYFRDHSKPSARGLLKRIVNDFCSTNDERHHITPHQRRRLRDLLRTPEHVRRSRLSSFRGI